MWPVTILIIIAIFLMTLERIIPDQRLPHVPGWWVRVILINLIQLGLVILGGITWDQWLQHGSLFDLSSLPEPVGAVIAYLLITLIFYWWHRWRHDLNFLWLLTHQFHHSPQRIETITSFYKHPLEILCNSVIIGAITYTGLGLTPEGGAWVMVITGVAEFFYHMNITTPRWVGYILQRPESHRIHHQMGKHYNNFADLPVWDMLFGTFINPVTTTTPCGFKELREQRIGAILCFKNVNGPLPEK
jgi:sterol desaturase/sphingolipid hydroxylase (fatty acid hydroxylase superfamily)